VRTYNQYCGVARALDLVGERWALLVVRELLFGPKRYSDLLAGIPGISTNILAARMHDLERGGVVARRPLPPPAGSIVYELTPYGRALEEPIIALGRWGGRSLGPPDGRRAFLPGWGLLAMRASFRPERALRAAGTYELRIDGEVFHIVVEESGVTFSAGPAEQPDLVMRTDAATFLALGAGELSPEAAASSELVELEGPRRRLVLLFDAFRFPAADPPPAPAG